MTKDDLREKIRGVLGVHFAYATTLNEVTDDILAFFDPAHAEIGRLAVKVVHLGQQDEGHETMEYDAAVDERNKAIAAYLTSDHLSRRSPAGDQP